ISKLPSALKTRKKGTCSRRLYPSRSIWTKQREQKSPGRSASRSKQIRRETRDRNQKNGSRVPNESWLRSRSARFFQSTARRPLYAPVLTERVVVNSPNRARST